jgi:N-acyl-L-homoserine lactone synthetase
LPKVCVLTAAAKRPPVAPAIRRSAVPPLEGIHRLRYQVYCLERRFLDMNAYPECREADRYDHHALHLAATDVHGEVAATLRLVLDSPYGFPVEDRGVQLFSEFDALPRERTGEISRLILAPEHRRTSAGPLLLFGLFRELYAESRKLGLHGLIAAMEEGLCRLLAKVGLVFRAIGECVDYFGLVTPYWASVDALEHGYHRMLAHRPRPGAPVFRFHCLDARAPLAFEEAV